MGTAKSPDLGHVHPFTGVMDGSLGRAVMDARHGTAVMDESPGTAAMGGTQVESRGRVATPETMIIGIVAQRAETRTSEVTHGILHTGDY